MDFVRLENALVFLTSRGLYESSIQQGRGAAHGTGLDDIEPIPDDTPDTQYIPAGHRVPADAPPTQYDLIRTESALQNHRDSSTAEDRPQWRWNSDSSSMPQGASALEILRRFLKAAAECLVQGRFDEPAASVSALNCNQLRTGQPCCHQVTTGL